MEPLKTAEPESGGTGIDKAGEPSTTVPGGEAR